MHRLRQKHSIGILLVIGLDRNHWALQCMQLASGWRKCYDSLRPNNNQIDASDLNVWRPALLYAKINGCVLNHLLPYLSICCFERIRVNIFQVGYSFMKCTQKVYTKQSNTSVWNTVNFSQSAAAIFTTHGKGGSTKKYVSIRSRIYCQHEWCQQVSS